MKVAEKIREEVSEAAGSMAAKLLNQPLMGKEELTQLIDQYDYQIEQVALSHRDVDVNLAHAIATVCRQLLRDHWDDAREDFKKLIQLACVYYIEEEDDEGGDFDSVIGFDDDAQVLNILLDQIGRTELQVLI